MATSYEDYVNRRGYYGVTDEDPIASEPGLTNEALFPRTNIKYPKATGATGPAQPPPTQPPPTQSSSVLPPAAQAALNNLPSGVSTWQDHIVDTGQAALAHYQNPPAPVPVYTHWYAGSGGISGGNNATMNVTYSDGSIRTVDAGAKPGEFLPTQPNITYSGQPANPETPTNGWLNRALAAVKAGEGTYSTGAPVRTSPGGLYPTGSVTTGSFSSKGDFTATPQGRTYVSTPTGGVIGLPSAAESAAAKTETAKRYNLYDSIRNSQNPKSYKYPTRQLQARADEAQATADKEQRGYTPAGRIGQEYRGRNLTGEVLNY